MGRKKKNNNYKKHNNNNNYNNNKSSHVYDGPLPIFNWETIDDSIDLSEDNIEKINFWTNILSNSVDNNYKDQIYNHLKKTIQQLPTLSQEKQINGLYDFYKQHPNVQEIKESWPESITNNKFYASGFKVCSASGKRLWGGDDGIYRSNPLLQENLPRGCVMIINKENNIPLSLGIFGNRKFYGKTSGDDDESDLTSETIRRGSYSKFLISNKANGESCHINICSEDKSLWIIGSKNRKIAVRSKKDIVLYKKEKCYSMAIEMADTFFNYLSQMGKEKEEQLQDLLLFTNWTLNFEFEYPQHQHIVPLLKPQLVLIGCSGIHVPYGKASHPIIGCSIARYFMFPSVLEDLQIYNKDQLDIICKNIAKQWNTEGSVLILLDDMNNVIDLVKVKAWWYILLRCIREKIRKIKGPESIQSTCLAVINRIQTLTNSMNIDKIYSSCFICFGTAFVEWLGYTTKDGKTPRLDDIIDLYPNRWLEFLNDKNLPLDDSLLKCDFSNEESNKYDKYSRKNLPLLILLQGIPGIGKSFFAKKLAEKLNSENIKTKDIAQDDFVKDVGLKNSGKACLNYIRGTLIRREYSCIILARNNSNPQQYQSYLNLDYEGLCRVAFICPKELNTRIEEIVMLSVAGVLYRQNQVNESHPTDDMDTLSLASLPLKFFGSLRVNPSAFTVPFLIDDKIPLPNTSQFSNLLQRFKSKGFRSSDLTQNDLKILGLDDINKQNSLIKYRRDINQLTQDSYKFINYIISKETPIPNSYFAISLHSDSSNRLLEFVKEYFPDSDIPKAWNIFSDHVTLMHSNSYFSSSTQVSKWDKLQKYCGTLVTIKLKELLINQKLATVKVSCSTTQDDISLNKFVISNIPHITIATAPGTSAIESSSELQNAEKSLLIDISQERDLTGILTLLEKNK